MLGFKVTSEQATHHLQMNSKHNLYLADTIIDDRFSLINPVEIGTVQPAGWVSE